MVSDVSPFVSQEEQVAETYVPARDAVAPHATLELPSEPVVVEQAVGAEPQAVEQQVATVEQLSPAEDVFEAQELGSEDLGKVRGTFASDANLNILDAISAYNQNSNSVTGSNVVSSDAFTNTSGLVSVIQNSGNNVIIQSATIVNYNAN